MQEFSIKYQVGFVEYLLNGAASFRGVLLMRDLFPNHGQFSRFIGRGERAIELEVPNAHGIWVTQNDQRVTFSEV